MATRGAGALTGAIAGAVALAVGALRGAGALAGAVAGAGAAPRAGAFAAAGALTGDLDAALAGARRAALADELAAFTLHIQLARVHVHAALRGAGGVGAHAGFAARGDSDDLDAHAGASADRGHLFADLGGDRVTHGLHVAAEFTGAHAELGAHRGAGVFEGVLKRGRRVHERRGGAQESADLTRGRRSAVVGARAFGAHPPRCATAAATAATEATEPAATGRTGRE